MKALTKTDFNFPGQKSVYKTVDGALGAAEFLGKFWLADVVLFHQVRKTDVGWCGQIFLCHVVGPPF